MLLTTLCYTFYTDIFTTQMNIQIQIFSIESFFIDDSLWVRIQIYYSKLDLMVNSIY